ncbi:glycosyltransferase family A protein [Burkholderia sp. RS01]|uniref:glycosyltransferase family A protein n=1 Tax=unclassified Burkholderia TaxID=2613784 RepID=UPI00321871DE
MIKFKPRLRSANGLILTFLNPLKRIGRANRMILANVMVRLPESFVPSGRRHPGVIVSLTSFPGRIETLWISLESIYRQKLAPEQVVLVLSEEEFPDHRIPSSVSAFASRGLKIVFHKGNIRSFKKLLPLLDNYADKVIVTADDDVIYPRSWLQQLVEAHNDRPDYVLGHRGASITGEGMEVAPYIDWSRANEETPSSHVFLTGMGGILYPPGALPTITGDASLAMQLCPTADDVWFKAMTLINDTPVAKIGNESGNFPVVRSAQKLALHHENVKAGQNDLQFRAVMDHFDLWDRLSPLNS